MQPELQAMLCELNRRLNSVVDDPATSSYQQGYHAALTEVREMVREKIYHSPLPRHEAGAQRLSRRQTLPQGNGALESTTQRASEAEGAGSCLRRAGEHEGVNERTASLLAATVIWLFIVVFPLIIAIISRS